MSEPAVAQHRRAFPEPPGGRALTSAQKAAVVITALGPEAAGDILRKMSQKNLRSYAQALSELREIPTEVLEAIVDEFTGIIDEGRLFGGRREAKAMLSRVLSADALAQLFDEDGGASDKSVWSRLAKCPEAAISSYLNCEHPQVCALVLSRLSTEKAARIIARMEPMLAEIVLSRLSHIATPAAETLQVVSDILEAELVVKIAGAESSRRPDEMISAILNHLPGEKRDPLFRSLEGAKPEMAAAVQRKMFTFNDIARRVDPRQVSILTRAVEPDVLRTALAFGRQRNSPSVEFILSNISKRVAEQYEDDLATAATVRGREGEEAHATLIAGIRAMAEKGEIDLISDEEEDEDFL